MKKYSLLLALIFSAWNFNVFAQNFTLESSAFPQNSAIPPQFTCNGGNKVPPLKWTNAPEKTQSFALVMQDPDAPDGTWTHWILFNIPPTVNQIDTDNPIPQGALIAQNSWKKAEYDGPCPDVGMHQYVITLYALDKQLDLQSGADKNAALDAMTSHVLGSAKLVGLYQKQE